MSQINTIQTLAARLTAVENKIATLKDFKSPGVDATSIDELAIRLSLVEKTEIGRAHV